MTDTNYNGYPKQVFRVAKKKSLPRISSCPSTTIILSIPRTLSEFNRVDLISQITVAFGTNLDTEKVRMNIIKKLNTLI